MDTDSRVLNLLHELLALIDAHGTRSSKVKELINVHRNVGDFESLALIIIRLAEESDACG